MTDFVYILGKGGDLLAFPCQIGEPWHDKVAHDEAVQFVEVRVEFGTDGLVDRQRCFPLGDTCVQVARHTSSLIAIASLLLLLLMFACSSLECRRQIDVVGAQRAHTTHDNSLTNEGDDSNF